MDPVDGNRSEPEGSGGVTAGGSDPSGVGGRPGWVGLMVAGAVVLVVGGFALSRDYGVQSIPPPPDLEEIATPTTSGASSSTVITVPVSGTDVGSSESIDSGPWDWTEVITDLAVSDDGALLALSPGGIARLDDTGWTIIDTEGLPQGKGLDWVPGRLLNHIAAGPNGVLWVAGEALSGEDDEQFGGTLDWGARILRWVARLDCPESCTWTVFSSDGFPELSTGLDDMVISGDGTLFASAGANVLLKFDGSEWESHDVLTGWSVPDASSPWSESLAVGTNGVVWAAVREKGLFAFDGEDFTRYTTDHGLPSNNVFQVAAAADGTIWAAALTSYIRPAPGGVASFDGTSWTIHTSEDGLLSSDAFIATGTDGTVWTIHPNTWPLGYSRFAGTGWTTYLSDPPVGGFRSAVASDGTLWTISDEGLISFDGITRTIHPSPFFTFTPVDWGIHPHDAQAWGIPPDETTSGPGVYSVHMITGARPLTAGLVEDQSGRLIWDETVVDLCNIEIRHEGDGFVHIGDIFQTTEGCGANPTAMQNAFDEFGLPKTACVTVRFGGLDHEYCAPLQVPEDISVGSEPGTVTVSLDGLEGFYGFAVDALVVPIDPSDEWQRLGETHFWPIVADPYSASQVIQIPDGFDFDGEVTALEPGTYRFIIEAYVPSGEMFYGCEMPIQMVEGESLVVAFTSLPTYTESGIHWTPLSELEYPDCPN